MHDLLALGLLVLPHINDVGRRPRGGLLHMSVGGVVNPPPPPPPSLPGAAHSQGVRSLLPVCL